MTIQFNDTKTLRGYSLGTEVAFYGTNAEVIAEVCDLVTEPAPNGSPRLMMTERMTDIFYPRLVKAGYRIAIRDTP